MCAGVGVTGTSLRAGIGVTGGYLCAQVSGSLERSYAQVSGSLEGTYVRRCRGQHRAAFPPIMVTRIIIVLYYSISSASFCHSPTE